MSKVIAVMSLSVDGYVADASDEVAEVPNSYFSAENGGSPHAAPRLGHDVPRVAGQRRAPRGLDGRGRRLPGRAAHLRGRARLGRPPSVGVPAVVLTHKVPDGWPRPGSTVQFVTDGIDSAVAAARSTAGGRAVAVHGADTIRQCLAAGLLQEIHIDLAAVLFGSGVRLFDHDGTVPLALGTPTVTDGVGVTHSCATRCPDSCTSERRGIPGRSAPSAGGIVLERAYFLCAPTGNRELRRPLQCRLARGQLQHRVAAFEVLRSAGTCPRSPCRPPRPGLAGRSR